MNHIYIVHPVEHQPQWPTNDNQPEARRSIGLMVAVAVCVFAVLLGLWA